eukprot:TRINITY_DN3213_c0_g1_i1.p1 TRINITY_DN3213_c0_g1~~TRINITY_DN3213_c0_g1_i1.p1  ORF type:complete len:591 (-),score=151.77 TRINITY_DN3213_c0_g1_i1:43-1815(-)
MKISTILFGLVCAFAVTRIAHAVTGSFNGGSFSITWTVSADNQNVTFVMSTSGSPWMSWGVNNEKGNMMVGTDVVVCQLINNAPFVNEFQIFNKTRAGIVTNQIQSIVGTVSVVKGVTICQWTRPVIATNTMSQSLSLTGFSTFNWAIGQLTDTNFMAVHSQRGSVNVDLVKNISLVSPAGLVSLAPEFQVQIQNDLVNNVVQLTMVSTNNAWVSVGPSSGGTMATTFGYICDASAMKITAYTINGNNFESIQLAAMQNITTISVTYTGGKLSCVFSRPSVATQAGDINIGTVSGAKTMYTWAVGQSGTLALDNNIHANRGAFTATVSASGTVLISANATPTDPHVLAHVGLMIIAWFFAAPAASLFARFFKYKTIWFQAHRTLNLLVVVCVTVSFIVIYAFQKLNLGGTIPHHAFGVFIIVLMYIQVFLGFFKPVIKDVESVWKKVWNHAHQFLGHSLYLFSFINAMLGQRHIDNIDTRNGIIVGCVIPFLLYNIVWLYLQFRPAKKDEQFDAQFDYMLNAKMHDERTTVGGKTFAKTDKSVTNMFRSVQSVAGSEAAGKKSDPTGGKSEVAGRSGRFDSAEFDKRFNK